MYISQLDLITVLITVSFKRRSIVYFYQSPFHSRILAVLTQTSDHTLDTSPQVSVEHEERGVRVDHGQSSKQLSRYRPRSRESYSSRQVWLPRISWKPILPHPHNAVLCEQLSLT